MPISSSMMWMAQLRGENKIRLIPHYPCNATCTTLYAVLHEGETGENFSLCTFVQSHVFVASLLARMKKIL
jgi:hypothetical protein